MERFVSTFERKYFFFQSVTVPTGPLIVTCLTYDGHVITQVNKKVILASKNKEHKLTKVNVWERGKHCTNLVRSIKAALMICGALDFVLFLREKVTLVKVRVLI